MKSIIKNTLSVLLFTTFFVACSSSSKQCCTSKEACEKCETCQKNNCTYTDGKCSADTCGTKCAECKG